MNFKLKKSDLNFKVYTVSSKPTAAGVENDIAIISSVPMANWLMSPEKPSGIPRTDGDVWIQYSVSGDTFNALKQNVMMIATISAYQYVDGAWVDREAVSYQGGVWVDWWDGSTIYKDGKQYEFITGGWKNSGLKWGSQTVGSGSIAYDEYLTVKANSGGVFDATTAKKLDLTAYSQLLYDIALDSSTDEAIVIVHNIDPGGTLVSGSTRYWAAASNNGVISLTGLNGEYYISVAATNNRIMKIGNIRLIK